MKLKSDRVRVTFCFWPPQKSIWQSGRACRRHYSDGPLWFIQQKQRARSSYTTPNKPYLPLRVSLCRTRQIYGILNPTVFYNHNQRLQLQRASMSGSNLPPPEDAWIHTYHKLLPQWLSLSLSHSPSHQVTFPFQSSKLFARIL